jgi:hypothetical protein
LLKVVQPQTSTVIDNQRRDHERWELLQRTSSYTKVPYHPTYQAESPPRKNRNDPNQNALRTPPTNANATPGTPPNSHNTLDYQKSHPINWSIKQVFDFFQGQNYGYQLAERFRKNDINGRVLLMLKEPDLLQLGVKDIVVGPLLAHIKEHSEKQY